MKNPLIFGHRGASASKPENTLSAFKQAFDEGADGIEFDVRMTADSEIVIIHDESIDRTSNGKGNVADHSFSTLSNYDYGEGEQIPLLRQVLEQYGNKKWLNIELKELGLEKQIIEMLNEYKITQKIVISSFLKEAIQSIRKLNKEIPTALLYVYNFTNLRKLKREYAINGIHPFNKFVHKFLIRRANRNGLFVNTWTVDNPTKAVKLAKARVNGIITNKPKLILEHLKKHKIR